MMPKNTFLEVWSYIPLGTYTVCNEVVFQRTLRMLKVDEFALLQDGKTEKRGSKTSLQTKFYIHYPVNNLNFDLF